MFSPMRKKGNVMANVLSRRLTNVPGCWHRQGKNSLHISGIGQEAAQIGAVSAFSGKELLYLISRSGHMMPLGMTPTSL